MAIKRLKFQKHTAFKKHELLTALVRGKNVVHYGCVDDDMDLIRHKNKSGHYLHKLVTNSAKTVVGIDLNKESFAFLEKYLGISNVVYGDVENPATFDLDKKVLKRADLVLIPDLIEHLSNPGNMLQGIKKYFSPDVKILILTPNPFAWYNFAATLFHREIYTPYHTIYFTTESIAILLDRYDMKVDRILPVTAPKKRGILVRALEPLISKGMIAISPAFADLFLYECSITKRNG